MTPETGWGRREQRRLLGGGVRLAAAPGGARLAAAPGSSAMEAAIDFSHPKDSATFKGS